jgi:hypothetical protein
MSSDTQNVNKAEKKGEKHFYPNERLTEWITERLDLERKRTEFESTKKAGEKLSKKLYKEIKASGARKTEILDDIIFQSMANLIYFFQAIYESPQLNELFEKDVIELLDPRRVREDINLVNGRMNSSGLAFRQNNFARLVLTALTIPNAKMKKKGPLTDFRIALLYQLQSIIRDKVEDILRRDHGWSGHITLKAGEEFYDTLRWLALIAEAAAEEVKDEHNRVIDVQPMKLTN